MKTLWPVLCLLTLVPAATMGCSAGGSDLVNADDATEDATQEEELRRAKAVTMTEDDEAKTINVTHGVPFVIKLETDRAHGYGWYLGSAPRRLGTPAVRYSSANKMTSFTWKTEGPTTKGIFDIRLEYRRGPTAAPTRTFAFAVNIVLPGEEGRSEGEVCEDPRNTRCAGNLLCVKTSGPGGGFGDLSGRCKRPE